MPFWSYSALNHRLTCPTQVIDFSVTWTCALRIQLEGRVPSSGEFLRAFALRFEFLTFSST